MPAPLGPTSATSCPGCAMKLDVFQGSIARLADARQRFQLFFIGLAVRCLPSPESDGFDVVHLPVAVHLA